MTRDETKQLLILITTTYPNFRLNSPEQAVDVWHKIFEPDDYRLIENAFLAYVRNDATGFAPSPGKLHMMIAEKVVKDYSDGEILDMLIFAARNANYGFEDEFNKFPPLLQKAVGTATVVRSWGTMEQKDLEYTHNIILRAYKELVTREKKGLAEIGINYATVDLPFLDTDATPLLERGINNGQNRSYA